MSDHLLEGGAASEGLSPTAIAHALASSSPATRIAKLQHLKDSIEQKSLHQPDLPDTLELLFTTHASYQDRKSRIAVQNCLVALIASGIDLRLLEKFTRDLREKSTSHRIAPSSAFVLAEWCSLLMQQLAGSALWDYLAENVILADAALLEQCLQPSARHSVGRSALVVTRRGFRKLFKSTLPAVEKTLTNAVTILAAKTTSQPSARNSILLGVIADVSIRQEHLRPILETLKSQYHQFYIREILGSRTALSRHITFGLQGYFSGFADLAEIDKELVPALEKGLLRAPEVILDGGLKILVESLPRDFDLSNILANKLLKHLLSNVKSSNATVRNGALSAFRAIIGKCQDPQAVERIVGELIDPLKSGKIASADHRAIHADMIDAIPLCGQSAEKIVAALATVTGKEGNEAALTAETSAMTRAVINLLKLNVDVPKSVFDTMQKGLVDKKPGIRRIWLIRAGRILQTLDDQEPAPLFISFAEMLISKLISNLHEVIANTTTAAQNGLIVGAYILTALVPQLRLQFVGSAIDNNLDKAAVMNHALASPQAYLLNPRLYNKLHAEEDLRWLCLAIYSIGSQLRLDSDREITLSWAETAIFLITASHVSSRIQQEMVSSVSKLYVRNPKLIAGFVIDGLWNHVSELEKKDDSTTQSLIRVLRSICLEPEELSRAGKAIDNESLQEQACAMMILSNSRLIARSSWIDLCLRIGIDPGNLTSKHVDRLLEEIHQRTSPTQKHESIKIAAYNAAAELAFISPYTMFPRLIELISSDLDPARLSGVGPIEAAILRTPEGTCFVDVLAKKTQNAVLNKNTKDYNLLKWEEELRSQIKRKTGQQRKLTAEETSKVNAQLKKEAQIRSLLKETEAKLLRAIGIIQSLVMGPPTDATLWLGTALALLLNIIEAGANLIVGDAAALTFIACSEKMATKLGVVRSSIGAASLRVREVSLPQRFSEERLEDLVIRVLYRLRFVSEQRPFDPASLIYALPLIFDIIRRGGVGENLDDRDAQIVLAIEIIGFHTDVFGHESTPRAELFTVLIEAMQKYTQHYKLIKDCFSDVCRCIAPSINEDELVVLATGATVQAASVRTAVLQSISAEVDMSDLTYSDGIWLACHDDVDENAELGKEIWEESGFQLDRHTPAKLISYLASKDGQLRRAAARSMSEATLAHKEALDPLIPQLMSIYQDLSKQRVQLLDEYGLPKKMDLSDPWEGRHGVATAIKELSTVFNKRQTISILNFLIDSGPVGDQNSAVRAEMLDAAIKVIDEQGKAMVDELMAKLEDTLKQPGKSNDASDRVNEAVIIMYGAMARHLKPGDKKIPLVIERLLATLSTPSETVQFAIAECLPPLTKICPQKSSEYFTRLTGELLTSKKYATQRGAAYGLAGLVSGNGISALREFRVMASLRGAMENKKDAHQREAALLAFELLSTILGRLFEPYVIQIVPQLLGGFGDANADVRDACLGAAKACFGKLSSYGVKQIMPTLLDGLDDQQWRSKRGACDLLGAMAYLDPQQLANSLPDVIPPLTSVLNDSHKEVRAAANRSLKRFGEVISNPEIKSLVDILLKALSDPTKYTDEALDSLIKVQFVHYLDAPSLALVTRILQRGLDNRSGTKRKAAQVIGSLAHLTEKKDIIKHLPTLVSGLKIAVVDPVPTTRATASRALGSLVEKLGEDALPDLISGLMQTLRSDTGAGDRLGSAQALSEVLAGLGTARLEETLPTILQNVSSAKPAVREGFMSLFIFLPVCFGNSFSNYLGRIVPQILAGLADDVESIRETALRAGRLLVKNFAIRAVDLLLPELERGLVDDNYRIRLSSVELVGDLLFNLTGIRVDDEAAGEDDEATKEASASLKEVLGEDKRNKILSALYICRCDTAGAVRSAAISVWKALVHSPKLLKELVPTLTHILIRRLGSSNMEHKIIASNALGELIRKAGDGVLASLLPTLEEGLQTSSDSDAKQGICLALRELISSAALESLEDHEKTLISVVRTALTDSDEEVREAAADAFDSLQQIFGKRAVDQVLPFLLHLLRSEHDADNALSALLTLLTETTRCNIILPNLVPTLTTPPISAFDAKALASLSKVAGPAMNRRLPSIINSLMDNEINCEHDDLRAELAASCDTVIQSIDEFEGLNTVMNILLGLLKHEDHRRRAVTARHMSNFFATSGVNYSRYHQDIIRSLLSSFDDSDLDVVKAAWTALDSFTRKLRKEEMESLVISSRSTLQRVGVAGANLRGFELPKGINAILPIFLQGLMNGSAEQRVQAALGISDIVDRTSETSLRPFVTQITGPLIRVVSERATEVKSAILLTLNNLLEKIPAALKPFLPQLQRTFAKSLADTSSEILRTRAAKALGTLIKYTPRIDPLIAELVTGSKTTDAGVKTAMLKALYEVISKAGVNMGDASRSAVLSLIDTDTDYRDEAMMMTNAKLLGALMKNVPKDTAINLIKTRVFSTELSVFSALCLNSIMVESPGLFSDSAFTDELPDLLRHGMSDKNVYIADNCILATGKVLLSSTLKGFDNVKKLFDSLAGIIQPGNPTYSRRLALVIVRTLNRKNMEMVRPYVAQLAASIFASVRDPVIPVKLAAEAAFVELFNVADEDGIMFDKYMAGPGNELAPTTKRSMGDYFKRVAMRLGAQVRERREAEGGQGGLGLSNDEVEDEREIWSVGKVDMPEEIFE